MNERNQILSSIRKGTGFIKDQGKMPLFNKRKKEELLIRWEKIEKQGIGNRDELVKTFKMECELLSGKVYMARPGDEASQSLLSIIRETGAERIIKWDSSLLNRLGIDRLLESSGAQDISLNQKDISNKMDQNDHIEALSRADIGISGADYGLADTGTLVLRTSFAQDRSTTLLPPVHVAIIESANILAGSDDLIVRLLLDLEENGEPDSCLTLITGPSRTADIELNLVLGIHGPKDLRVIIV